MQVMYGYLECSSLTSKEYHQPSNPEISNAGAALAGKTKVTRKASTNPNFSNIHKHGVPNSIGYNSTSTPLCPNHPHSPPHTLFNPIPQMAS